MYLVGFGEAMIRYAPQANASPQADPNAQLMLRSIGGDELNVCVATSKLNSNKDLPNSEWVSVLPSGPLGDLVYDSGELAGVNQEHVIRMKDADVGTFTVLPKIKAVHYQRRNSAFAQHDASIFDWQEILTSHDDTWLHMTGITPMITDKTRYSWTQAMDAAMKFNIPCSVDFNHRPQLGSIDNLWNVLQPYVNKLEFLIMSMDSLRRMSEEVFTELSFPPTTTELGNSDWLQFLLDFRAVSNAKRVAVCFKNRNDAGVQKRWSVIVDEAGCHSTELFPVFHKPKDECGGGSAWAAGLLHWIAENKLSTLSTESGLGTPKLQITSSPLVSAARRADILAALCQESAGDHSQVEYAELQRVENEGKDDFVYINDAKESEISKDEKMERTFSDLKDASVVAIIRANHPEAAIARAIELCGMGCRAIEVTLDTVEWRRVLQEIVRAVPDNVVVGVGTVMDEDVKNIKDIAALGARFALSPIEPFGFIDECHKHGILAVPAGMTSNELWDMHRRGARVLKMFHAGMVGPTILKSMLGVTPLSAMNILPSGGCDPKNYKEWLIAGAFCVGMGSNLTGNDIKAKPGSPEFEEGKRDWEERGKAIAQTLFLEINNNTHKKKVGTIMTH
eukprot:m.23224 g.23224  ORF g.23224 m.23224 type:complete len:621 (+) comp5530_c0_seq5:27-1889(+)